MNPYESPELVEEEDKVEPPAPPRWWATIVKLAVCTLLLLMLWGNGAVAHGRSYYSREYGFIGFYKFVRVQGVVTASEIQPAELALTIAFSLAIVIFGIGCVRRHVSANS